MDESAEPDLARTFSRVLVVDDEEAVRHMLSLMLRREGFEVREAASGEEALPLLGEFEPQVMISDVRMPGMGGLALVEKASRAYPEMTCVVMSAFGSIELAVDALKRGAYDYISKPFKQDEVVLTLRKAEERQRLRRENRVLRQRVDDLEGEQLDALVVHSDAMRGVAAAIRKIAPYRSTTLVVGESGVGKELVSRAIHRLSPRANGPFLAINCGAISDQLIESELFGHVRGAFTDAHRDKTGLFEDAHGGTVFLDEIGELPSHVQVKLLRVLQEQEVRRVGESHPRAVDVRVIAASGRPLDEMVSSGEFRQDLYYRLNVLHIEVPPLRERPTDVPVLALHFIARLNEELGTSIEGLEAEAQRQLLAYHWPGNVRELRNAIERAMVLSEKALLSAEHLPRRIEGEYSPGGTRVEVQLEPGDFSVKRAQRTVERELILRALGETGGNRTRAAKLLELSHRALLYKIRDFGLD